MRKKYILAQARWRNWDLIMFEVLAGKELKKKKKKKEQLLIEPSARVKGNRGVRQLVPAKRKRKEEKKGGVTRETVGGGGGGGDR